MIYQSCVDFFASFLFIAVISYTLLLLHAFRSIFIHNHFLCIRFSIHVHGAGQFHSPPRRYCCVKFKKKCSVASDGIWNMFRFHGVIACVMKKCQKEKNKYHQLRRRRRSCHRCSEWNSTELKAETHPNTVPSMMVSFVCFCVRFNQLLSFGSIIYHFHKIYFPTVFTSMAHDVSNPFSKILMPKLENLPVTEHPKIRRFSQCTMTFRKQIVCFLSGHSALVPPIDRLLLALLRIIFPICCDLWLFHKYLLAPT